MRAARITQVANFRFIWGVLMNVGTESVVCLKNSAEPKESCQVSNHMVDLVFNGNEFVTLQACSLLNRR
jgi:hypothetical protein